MSYFNSEVMHPWRGDKDDTAPICQHEISVDGAALAEELNRDDAAFRASQRAKEASYFSGLPCKIAGLNRNFAELTDSYGNFYGLIPRASWVENWDLARVERWIGAHRPE